MSTNKKAVILGLLLGAGLVIAALYFHSVNPPEKPVAMAAPNPHSFPAEREGGSSTPLLSGTITLDPSITQSPGSAVTVFIIARTGPGKGKPVLAKRIDAQSFPLTFTLTGADSMMAGARPAEVSLEARIDLDGDALTREPGSPTARIASVSLGSNSVALTLKPEA